MIRRQILEIDELRRRVKSTDVTLQSKYEESLRKIEMMVSERARLVEEVETYRTKYRSQETEAELLKRDMRELEEYRRKEKGFEQHMRMLTDEI